MTVRAGSAAKKAEDEKAVSASKVSSVKLREKSQVSAKDTPVVVSKSSASEIRTKEVKILASDRFEGWLGRCCLECESTDHREDATFCWNCGSKL